MPVIFSVRHGQTGIHRHHDRSFRSEIQELIEGAGEIQLFILRSKAVAAFQEFEEPGFASKPQISPAVLKNVDPPLCGELIADTHVGNAARVDPAEAGFTSKPQCPMSVQSNAVCRPRRKRFRLYFIRMNLNQENAIFSGDVDDAFFIGGDAAAAGDLERSIGGYFYECLSFTAEEAYGRCDPQSVIGGLASFI